MTSSQNIVKDYLNQIKSRFYPNNEKAFYQQRWLLIKAITYPAKWLDKRGVFLPEADYRKILDTVISGIKAHGNTDGIRYFGRYFLDCIQKHIKHHEEQYYDHAKGLQAKATLSMAEILKGVQVAAGAPDGTSVEHLAALNSLVKSPGGGRRLKKHVEQPTIF